MVKYKSGTHVYLLFVFIIAMILSINSITALTARVGNGKFVISNATVGETIERTMKVYNNNTYDVRVELIPSGNLSNYIKIPENNITMTPNSEKEIRFSVTIPKEGKNDGGINVKFIAVDMVKNGKNGVVIPTTMIIFAQTRTGVSNQNKTSSGSGSVTKNDGLSIFETLLGITAIIFIILLLLLFLYTKRKNRGVKGEKLNTKKSKN